MRSAAAKPSSARGSPSLWYLKSEDKRWCCFRDCVDTFVVLSFLNFFRLGELLSLESGSDELDELIPAGKGA